MLDKMGDMFKMMQKMQHLMKDENFRNFVSHPKVREVMKDPELQSHMKSQNFSSLMSHPKFSSLMRDPEIAQLISKLDLKKLSGS